MQLRSTIRHKQRGSFTAASLLVCLLLLFALPFVADAQAPDSILPICCQSKGRHQCSLRLHAAIQAGQAQQEQGTTATSPTLHDKCPDTPLAPAGTHSAAFAIAAVSDGATPLPITAVSAPQQHLVSHSTPDRSNPKRGPPSYRPTL